jgi:hypothetical protein
VPADFNPGSYSIQVGIFEPGWSGMHDWNSTAGSLTVSSSVPPTATKTATPVPATKTPTKAPTTAPTKTATPVAATKTPTSVPATKTPTKAPTKTATPVPSGEARFTVSASGSPRSVARGQSVTLVTGVTSTQATTVLIDVEVYDAAGKKVYQKWYDNVSLSANTKKTVRPVWAVPSGQAAGKYTIKVGVFKPGWQGLLEWKDPAGTVTVTTGTSASGAPDLLAPESTDAAMSEE